MPDEEHLQMMAVPGMMVTADMPLGSGGALRFSWSVDLHESQHEIDLLIDKVCRAADRRRAMNQLPDRRYELKQLRWQLEEHVAHRDKAQQELEAYREARAERLVKLDQEYRSLYDRAYSTHFESGRQSEFEPHGADRSRLERLAGEIEQLKAPIDTKEQSAYIHLVQAEAKVTEFERLVDKQLATIAHLERMLRGEELVD